MMSVKKRFAAILLVMLVVAAVVFVSACECDEAAEEQEAMLSENDGNAADEAPISRTTPKPTPKPTPAPTLKPTPQPTPTPAPRYGINFSEEDWKRMEEEYWQLPMGQSEFGIPTATYLDNDYEAGKAFCTFGFSTDMPDVEVLKNYGNMIFGEPLDNHFFMGTVPGLVDINGDPLEVSVDIFDGDKGSDTYIHFTPKGELPIVDVMHQKYWPVNGLVNDGLTDGKMYMKGISYYQDKQQSGMYMTWKLDADEGQAIFDWYADYFSGYDDYQYTEAEFPMGPKIAFTYVMEGQEEYPVTVNIDMFDDMAAEDIKVFKLLLKAKLKF